jgi:hypothetical protein
VLEMIPCVRDDTFSSIDNEFLGVTICSTTLSVMCYLYNKIFDVVVILYVFILSSNICACNVIRVGWVIVV